LETRYAPSCTTGIVGGQLQAIGDNADTVFTLDHEYTVNPTTILCGSRFADSSFSSILIDTGNGTDTVNLERIRQETWGNLPVTVRLGPGTDTVNLSPTQQSLYLVLARTSITITGGGGFDTVNLFDQSNTSGAEYHITSSAVQTVNYSSGGVTYSNIQRLVLSGSRTSPTQVYFESTGAGTPVTVNLGTGTDTVVFSLTANFLDYIQGNVIIHGGGSSTVRVYDQNDPYADTYTITNTTVQRSFSALITYDTIQNLEIRGSSTQDTIYNIESTAAGTAVAVYAGAGNDTFNISPTAQNLGTIQGSLFIDGGPGSNTINMWDAAVHNYTVDNTSTTVAGLSFAFTYRNIEGLVLYTKPGSNVTDRSGYIVWSVYPFYWYWVSLLTVYYTL
jgi:Ca2+-binding RTX toxin-like protein